MNILQVNTTDLEGGAAVVAWNLFKGFRQRGNESYFVVGRKNSNDNDVFEIDRSLVPSGLFVDNSNIRGLWRIRSLIRKYIKTKKSLGISLGWEDFEFPGSKIFLNLPPTKPDIVQLHNLHGSYFDLRLLPILSKKIPTVITLHDMWLLTGHCAHSLDCERWRISCGQCPYLSVYPSIQKDESAHNWRLKKRIFNKSKLHVTTPSKWLMDKVEASMLHYAVSETKVIHNGVDTRIFQPADKSVARQKMGLPEKAIILMFVASHNIKNHPFKDYSTIEEALQLVSQNNFKHTPIIFLALGKSGDTENIGNLELRFLPYLRTREELACLYQAADLYVHAAKADNFPNSILEALACGTPVVATGVGGIPEQIENGKSGIITKPSDPTDMAQAIIHLLKDGQSRMTMANYAAQTAKERFSLDRQIDQYLDWYKEILEREKINALPQA